MRKVKYKNWVPAVYTDIGRKDRALIAHTGCWQPEYCNDGLFHQWAAAYTEFETGAGNYTVAIIELPDGTIQEVLPVNVKFIN